MDLAQNVKEYLAEKYQDTTFPGSYAGPVKFYKAIRKDKKFKVTLKKIREFLQSQEYFTLLKDAKTRFLRNKVIVPYQGYQIDCDTAYIPQYGKENKGKIYVIGAIDCFSKEAHTIAIKSLKSSEFIPALEKVLKRFDKVEHCRTDGGTEFKSKAAKVLFNKLGIKHFIANNTETKSNIIERFFKTLKALLYRYMLAQNTHKWEDQLENITRSYNLSYHSTIKQSPASVKPSDEYKIWKLLYETQMPNRIITTFRFKIHDTVRISNIKHKFTREFDETWTCEHFLVSDR
jgi:hypothetical protein